MKQLAFELYARVELANYHFVCSETRKYSFVDGGLSAGCWIGAAEGAKI